MLFLDLCTFCWTFKKSHIDDSGDGDDDKEAESIG